MHNKHLLNFGLLCGRLNVDAQPRYYAARARRCGTPPLFSRTPENLRCQSSRLREPGAARSLRVSVVKTLLASAAARSVIATPTNSAAPTRPNQAIVMAF